MDHLVQNGITLGIDYAKFIGNTSLETLQQQSGANYTTLADLISVFANGSVGTANLQDQSITNAKIANFSFNKAVGGTLTLGGVNNGNGLEVIQNSAGQVILRQDNLGSHYYNTAGKEVVRLDSLGLHNYNTSGVVLSELIATGFFAYGTSSVNFKKLPTDPTSYGIIGVDSMNNFIVASNNSNPLQLVGKTLTTLASLTSEVDISAQTNIKLGVVSGAIYLYGQTFVISDPTVITNNGAQAQITSGGFNKTAIVPTSEGYNALYCVEAPEVWFFDFCEDEQHIDPMFLEVTEGPMEFITCDSGRKQVWRRRKGFGTTRFELKTAKQFIKNNEFWGIPQN